MSKRKKDWEIQDDLKPKNHFINRKGLCSILRNNNPEESVCMFFEYFPGKNPHQKIEFQTEKTNFEGVLYIHNKNRNQWWYSGKFNWEMKELSLEEVQVIDLTLIELLEEKGSTKNISRSIYTINSNKKIRDYEIDKRIQNKKRTKTVEFQYIIHLSDEEILFNYNSSYCFDKKTVRQILDFFRKKPYV